MKGSSELCSNAYDMTGVTLEERLVLFELAGSPGVDDEDVLIHPYWMENSAKRWGVPAEKVRHLMESLVVKGKIIVRPGYTEGAYNIWIKDEGDY